MKQYVRHDELGRVMRMVSFDDAEAEIEKARRKASSIQWAVGLNCRMFTIDGGRTWHKGGGCQEVVQQSAVDAARADERKRIEDYIEKMLSEDDGMGPAGHAVRKLVLSRLFDFVKSLPSQPKPLEKFSDYELSSEGGVAYKLNAIVDAVNELMRQRRKS